MAYAFNDDKSKLPIRLVTGQVSVEKGILVNHLITNDLDKNKKPFVIGGLITNVNSPHSWYTMDDSFEFKEYRGEEIQWGLFFTIINQDSDATYNYEVLFIEL